VKLRRRGVSGEDSGEIALSSKSHPSGPWGEKRGEKVGSCIAANKVALSRVKQEEGECREFTVVVGQFKKGVQREVTTGWACRGTWGHRKRKKKKTT